MFCSQENLLVLYNKFILVNLFSLKAVALKVNNVLILSTYVIGPKTCAINIVADKSYFVGLIL